MFSDLTINFDPNDPYCIYKYNFDAEYCALVIIALYVVTRPALPGHLPISTFAYLDWMTRRVRYGSN